MLSKNKCQALQKLPGRTITVTPSTFFTCKMTRAPLSLLENNKLPAKHQLLAPIRICAPIKPLQEKQQQSGS